MIITQAAEKFNTDFPLLKYLSRYSTLIPPGSGREVSGSDVSEVLDSVVAASGCSGSDVSGADVSGSEVSELPESSVPLVLSSGTGVTGVSGSVVSPVPGFSGSDGVSPVFAPLLSGASLLPLPE